MSYLARIALSLPLTVAIMLISMVPAIRFPGWEWVVAFLTLPVVTWGAWPFHRAALINARHGASTMDTLVSLGVSVSTLWSFWVLIDSTNHHHTVDMAQSHHPHIYFEGAATITLFLLIGRYIERKTKGVARDALTSLMHLTAGSVTRVHVEEGGQRREEEVASETIAVEDLVLVRPGGKIPVDGVIVEGSSAIDVSIMTGESLPQDKNPGDEVIAGALNTWGTLLIRTTHVGAETTVAKIGQLVADAQADKAHIQRLADRISAVFVPAVIVLSLATFAAWYLIGGQAQPAVTAAVAVLVVACPCALGLATPTALMVGSAQAARKGVILRSIHALEATKKIDTIVFDKTGTITDGHMSVLASHIDTANAAEPEGQPWGEAAQWAAVASVEALSEHPIACAIVTQARSENRHPLPVSHFKAHAGHGVSGFLGDDLIIVGQPAWLHSLGVTSSEELEAFRTVHQEAGATVVVMARVPNAIDCVPASTGDDHSQATLPAEDGSDSSGIVQRLEVAIQGMTCASCVGRVERKLRKMPGVSAQVNLATEKALVTLASPPKDKRQSHLTDAADKGHLGEEWKEHSPTWSPQDIVSTIEAAGYQAQFLGYKGETVSMSAPVEQVSAPIDLAEVLGTRPTRASAAFAVKDSIKEGAADTIESLHKQGIEAVLLTGDQPAAAASVAQVIGITKVRSQVTPQQKRHEIQELQRAGNVVAMVGDGVNDAAALAQADLGIAMGSGTDVAQDVADIVLTTSRLSAVTDAVHISNVTLRIIRENLGWAFGYNALLIPLAVAGMLNPMLAAAAMSLSSVCVVGNSLRLRRLI